MTNDKRHTDEERQNQPVPQQQINLSEYAGDAEDNQLTCEQVNEYLRDLDRRQRMNQERRDDPARNDQ